LAGNTQYGYQMVARSLRTDYIKEVFINLATFAATISTGTLM
jgi:hypothetical protein